MSLFVDIEKRVGSFELKVKFETSDGVMALLGASGCGKSMTLKCIAGIEKPDRGRIVLDGVTLFDSEKKINVKTQKRGVGYLFQQYALFPNMTVEQNITAGARGRKDAESAVRHMIAAMKLEGLEHKRPHQLSGGQQQRTALARILVNEPKLLLLDEPFSALDSHLRFSMEQEVRDIIRGFGKTVLLVSHNRDEVYRMSDAVAVMNRGYIETVGNKKDVFANPGTKNGAVITGCKNISPIVKLEQDRIFAADWGMELCLGRDVGSAKYAGVRMHDVHPGEGENHFRCKVVEEIENPFSFTLMLKVQGRECPGSIGWETDKETWLSMRGEYVDISLPPEAIVLLEE